MNEHELCPPAIARCTTPCPSPAFGRPSDGTVLNRKVKMKHLVSIGLLVVTAVNLLAADPPDNKSLRGDWIPVKAELGGQPMAGEVLKTISLKLGDGTYDVSAA